MIWSAVYFVISFILKSVGFGCLVCLFLTRRGRLPSVYSIGFIVWLILLFDDILAVLGFPELQLTIKTSNPFLIRLFGTDDLSDKLFHRAFPLIDYMDVVFATIQALLGAWIARWLARRAFGENEPGPA
jgi:hypothetical protein